MSSGGDRLWLLLQQPIDNVGEMTFQTAQCFPFGFASRDLTIQVGAGHWMTASLRDGNLMEGAIELSVSSSAEPIAVSEATGDLKGGHAGIRCKFRGGRKPLDGTHFPEDLRRSQYAQARQGKSCGPVVATSAVKALVASAIHASSY
ncbi:MAG TPA: hypothetical protein VNU46_07530 [Gemmatimonadaceae bacterium]|jgi:hypothetical protein|nr:hypothetical protein [Gemmatimonadaceae bacterium]